MTKSIIALRGFRLLRALVVLGGLALSSPAFASVVVIDEIPDDNNGADEDEAIEGVEASGTDLSGWAFVLYGGSGGARYGELDPSGFMPDQRDGFGTISFTVATLQKGQGDGFALIDVGNEVVQFLRYDRTFTAFGGAPDGVESVDIGVSEDFSLQLTGVGAASDDVAWALAAPSTFGQVNTGQTFVPVPAALPLFASALAGLGLLARRC